MPNKEYYWKHREECLRKNREDYQKNRGKKIEYFHEYYRKLKEENTTKYRERCEKIRKYRQTKRYQENQKRYKKNFRLNPENRLKECKYTKMMQKKYPKKTNARQKAYKQIPIPAGTKCIMFGCERLATQRHHYDYDKPLDVCFICPSHHVKLDKSIFKDIKFW